jgi:hypothetical protein
LTAQGSRVSKGLMNDVFFKICDIKNFWFYKLKRHKTLVLKKEVISGVSKTPKRLQFSQYHGFRK